MKTRAVLDSNVIIGLQAGRLEIPRPYGEFTVSIISKIEVFSFANLTKESAEELEEIFSNVSTFIVEEEVAQLATSIRRQTRLKTPDAIIAATAVIEDADLITNDDHFFTEKVAEAVPGIAIRRPITKAQGNTP